MAATILEELDMLKKITATFVAVFLAMGLVPLSAFAQQPYGLADAEPGAALSTQAKKKLSNVQKKKMLSAYKDVMKRSKTDASAKAHGRGFAASRYTLYDMGADGIPELFVYYGYPYHGGFEVYDFTSGKARDLGHITNDGGRWLYTAPNGELYLGGGWQGMYAVDRVVKSSGKLVLKDHKDLSARNTSDMSAAFARSNAYMEKLNSKMMSLVSISSYSLLNSKIKVTYKMSEAKVSVTSSKTYTGKAVKPKVTVKVGGSTLKAGKGYTVTYRNAKGKKVSAPKAVGTYKVTVTGKGNLKGSVTKTFKVAKQASSKKATRAKTIALYKKTLKRAAAGKGVFAAEYAKQDKRWWSSSCHYHVFDIGNDGTSELIVRAGESTADQYDYVFTVKSGSLKYWGKYWCGTAGLYGSKSGKLYMGMYRQGYYRIYEVKRSGGAMATTVLDEGANDDYDAVGAHIRSYTSGLGASALDMSSNIFDYKLLKKSVK